MPLLDIPPGTNPTQLTVLARSKVVRERSRADHDLRLLLAHCMLLEQLQHTSAELFISSPTPKQSHETQHAGNLVSSSNRQNKDAALSEEELDELNELFDFAKVAGRTPSSASTVTIEVVELDDDWDA